MIILARRFVTERLFKEEKNRLIKSGLKVIEEIKLDPYEKDHIAFVCKKSF